MLGSMRFLKNALQDPLPEHDSLEPMNPADIE
jgi:hypothetical protein